MTNEELKVLAEAAVGKSYISGEKFFFSAEATPGRVLALIASAEQYEQDYKDVVGTIELRDFEISRLKAENAGLKTGYEAYEQVVQGLKAEVEGLRKILTECADSLHGEMLQKFGGQLPDDMHPVTRREYDRDMTEVAGYRAVMGKREQS